MVTTTKALSNAVLEAEEQLAATRETAEQRTARLAALDEEIAALSANLAAIDAGIAQVHQRGRGDLEALRRERRNAYARLDGLKAERPTLDGLRGQAEAEVKQASVTLAVARRRVLQTQGKEVSDQIKSLLGQVAQCYAGWQRLADADREQADICRSLDRSALTAVQTFEYATGVDGRMRAVLDECRLSRPLAVAT